MTVFSPFRLKQRAVAVQFILLGAFVVILGAFFRAQVIEHDDFQQRAENNRLRRLNLAAPRGFILDRDGHPIAENAPGFSIKLFATSKDSLRAVLGRMAAYAPVDDDLIEQVTRRFLAARYQPALVFGSATIETVAKLEEHRYLLPGLVVQTEPRRLYPAGRAVAHLVGFVAEVTDADLEKERYPGAKSGTIVGKDGLEQQYDSIIRGVEGESYIEVDARGRMVRDQSERAQFRPVPGEVIRTTIDVDLQRFIDSMWVTDRPTTRGAMMAMRPDGQVLALYSAPSYDPNEFIGGITSQRWASLMSDSAKPLTNRAVRGAFPPGSPFKLATAAIALKLGVVDFTSHMPQPCNGGLRFGNRVFKCWKPAGHGSLDLTGAIANSCDVYFYQLGLRIGLKSLLEEGTRLGFGSTTGVDVGSERSSIFPPSIQYYEKRYGPRGWSNAVTLNLSIGQGENDQSLVNMMRFYAALAGDGNIPTPYIVKPKTQPTISLGITPVQLAGLRDALVAVVERGTAARSGGKDLNVAGKTGTAQNSHGANHGWFIAFAPADDPKIVVGSIMEFAGHGTTVAPYVVKAIRHYLERLDPSLKHATVRVTVQGDSVATVDSTPADSTGR